MATGSMTAFGEDAAPVWSPIPTTAVVVLVAIVNIAGAKFTAGTTAKLAEARQFPPVFGQLSRIGGHLRHPDAAGFPATFAAMVGIVLLAVILDLVWTAIRARRQQRAT